MVIDPKARSDEIQLARTNPRTRRFFNVKTGRIRRVEVGQHEGKWS